MKIRIWYKFARTALTKYHWWLKLQKLISSRFWRLEIPDQGVGWVDFILLGLQMATFPLCPHMVCSISPVHTHV